MFVLVILLAFITASNAGISEMTPSKLKASSKGYSVGSATQKPEYYQPLSSSTTSSQPSHSFPYAFESKPVYVAQQQLQPQPPPQPTMVIIAHPAFIPQHILNQMGIVQQMVNYFQNNPQAKYQLLYGNQQQQVPHPTVQPYMQAVPVPIYQPAPQAYQQLVPAPVQLVQPSPLHLQQAGESYAPQQVGGGYAVQPSQQQQQQQQQPQSGRLEHIAELAQSVAQQYATSPKGAAPPAIITGLENFTPEQQAQIKAQLGLAAGGGQVDSGASQTPQHSSYSSKSKSTSLTSSSLAPHPTSSPSRAYYRN